MKDHQLEAYFGLMIVVAIGTILVPISRFYALRHKKRTPSTLTSDILYALASLYAIHNVVYLTYVIKRHINLLAAGLTKSQAVLLVYVESLRKFAVATGIGYIFEIWAIKTCFILFYWNLYRRRGGWRRYVLFGTAALIPAITIVEIVLYFTACHPFKWQWSLEEVAAHGGATCSSNLSLTVQVFISSTSIATDILVLTLGILILSALKLSKIDYYAVGLVALMGTLSLSASIARLSVLLATHSIYNQNSNSRPGTATIEAQDGLLFLSCLEIFAGQTAFALPSFRFLLRPGYARSLWTRLTSRLSPPNSRQYQSDREDATPHPPTIGTRPLRNLPHAHKTGQTALSDIEMGVLPDLSTSQERLRVG